MNLVGAATAAALLAGASQAGQWPSHGYFYVQRLVMGSSQRCLLRLELNIDNELLALVLSENRAGNRPLDILLMSSDNRVTLADAVAFKVDDAEILTFRPDIHNVDPEIATVGGFINDESEIVAMWRRLAVAAPHATWFSVVTGDITRSVSAIGLREALGGFCRLPGLIGLSVTFV